MACIAFTCCIHRLRDHLGWGLGWYIELISIIVVAAEQISQELIYLIAARGRHDASS